MNLRDMALDNEERASLALGAMKSLGRLIAGQERGLMIDPQDFTYLFQAVEQAVTAALELPCSINGSLANDD